MLYYKTGKHFLFTLAVLYRFPYISLMVLAKKETRYLSAWQPTTVLAPNSGICAICPISHHVLPPTKL